MDCVNGITRPQAVKCDTTSFGICKVAAASRRAVKGLPLRGRARALFRVMQVARP
jgi:hypothetical protein